MLLAITDLGYASCWVEGHITDDDRICDKMASILNVPSNYDLVCYLPIGKPIEEVKKVNKRRLMNALGLMVIINKKRLL